MTGVLRARGGDGSTGAGAGAIHGEGGSGGWVTINCQGSLTDISALRIDIAGGRAAGNNSRMGAPGVFANGVSTTAPAINPTMHCRPAANHSHLSYVLRIPCSVCLALGLLSWR